MSFGRLLTQYLIAGLVLYSGAERLGAQTFAPPFEADDPEGVFTPRDRRLQSLVDQAERELSDPDGDQREALQTLQRIADFADDVFTDSSMTDSVRSRARRIISEQPEQVRRVYEETFGPEASSLLEQHSGDPQRGQQEVVRRYFHTPAGAAAAYQLAVIWMDGGEMIRAARLFDRLLHEHHDGRSFDPELSARCILCYWRGGEFDRAAQLLVDAVQRQLDLPIADPAPDDVDTEQAAQQWLVDHLGTRTNEASAITAQWLLPQGSAARNANAAPVSPLFDDAWSVPLIGPRDAEAPALVEQLATLLESVAVTSRQAEWTAIPALSPIVVDNLVVVPSYGLLKAVDVSSGRLRWVALPADQTCSDLMTTTGMGQRQLSSEMSDFLQQRAYLDRTSSQISSDSERVYVVRDSGMVGGLSPQFAPVSQADHPRRARSFNALRAYDAEGGSWLWEVGGARTRVASSLAGTFFLGPPLSVDGKLYVLGEDLGQVRLHALTPETGEVEWSVPLANADADVEEELDRRLSGLSPTLAGGLLICPTGSGLIVAVDPLTRVLQWGLRYRDEQQYRRPPGFGRGPFIGLQPSLSEQLSLDELMRQPRWQDAAVVAAGAYVLVPTPDVAAAENERRLLCVSLLDGTIRWQRGRGDAWYIGGVYEQTIVLVGTRQVEGVSLANGQSLWTIPLAAPVGRGVRVDNLYHVPLVTDEIATIDLSTGRLLARSRTRSGQPLGNLVAVNGRLISQTATDVRSFVPRAVVVEQIARDLSSDPNDPAALAARGELALHSGDFDAGLADLRRVTAAGQDARAQQILVTTLLEGLRSDFAAYRPYVDELERLATEPDLRSQFLMTYADGLIEAGETTLGFEQYLRLLSHTGADSPMDYTGDRWVRRDRLIQGRLANLYAGADTADQQQLDALVEAELAAAEQNGAGEGIVKLARALSGPVSDGAAAQAVDTPHADELPIRYEAQLLRARSSSPADRQGIIAARLIELYVKHGRVEPVVQLLQELDTVWSDEPCLNEMTGAAWAADARSRAPVAAVIEQATEWPTQQISVREGVGTSGLFSPLRREGPFDPLTSGFLFLPDNQSQISIRDGFGRPINDGVLTMLPGSMGSFHTQYVMQRGHRAVLYQGTQFKLINLLDGSPRVLLEEPLVDSSQTDLTGFRRSRPNVFRQQGFRGLVLWSSDPGENGSVGPLNDSVFCFLREHELHGHDPFTGKRFWSVDEVPHGAEILADEDYVLLVPVGQNVAHVYRALDGEKLGVRTLPADVVRDRRGADWGRHFLRVSTSGADAQLAMYDPVSEQNRWQRTVSAEFRWAPRDGYDLCVVDQEGTLDVLDPPTGDVQYHANIDVPDRMRDISVLSLPEQWLLTTFRSPPADADAQLAPIQFAAAVNGPATAFERHTNRVMWTRVIANQMITPGFPVRWPILPMSAILQAAGKLSNGRAIAVLTRRIELIERRTGETVHTVQTDATGNSRNLDCFWEVRDTEPQLRLQFGMVDLELSFRNEAPQDAGDEEPPDAPAPPIPDARGSGKESPPDANAPVDEM